MHIRNGHTPLAARFLAAVLVGGGGALLIMATRPASGPAYSLAAVHAGLVRAPGAWVGRTIRVRAVAGISCVSYMRGEMRACSTWSRWPVLLDPAASNDEATLPLQGVPRPPLLAALRRLPLIGGVLPAPQQIRWGTFATYRVRLTTAPAIACGARRCYEALLLDATSGSLQE